MRHTTHTANTATNKAHEIAQFGHQRLQLNAPPAAQTPPDAQGAALLSLTAEATFLSSHARILATQPDLRGFVSEYFEHFFDQIAAGKQPERDALLEQCIVDSCGGTRAGDYLIQEMHRVASDLLMRQQTTGKFYVGGR